MHPNRRTWRIRGIPRDVDREWLSRALQYHSNLQWPGGDRMEDSAKGGNNVIVHTLAPDLRANYQVATVRFHNLPSELDALGARDELNIKINTEMEYPGPTVKGDSVSEVLIDEHFDGITTLFSPVTDDEHEIDVLAISGLGSHPFGSFVQKKDGNMWLTNNLPRDVPAARVMIFGYESKLQDSRSHVELDDLAGPVQIAISQISQSKKRPLLLIGHSLGGLLVKEALIRVAEPGFGNGLTDVLDRITGILLFGTPNDGLDIESLVPMVNDQPNRSLLESLNSKNSQVLRRQKQQFSHILGHTKLQLVCFYETELSPTAIQDAATGRWKMDGPHRFLVSQPSATSCLPAGASSAHSVSIRRNHSDLVKFSSHDAEYDKIAYIIKQMKEIFDSHRTQEREFQCPRAIREAQNDNSITGRQGTVTRGTQIHNPVKRTANDMLSPRAGKRPQTSSHSTENAPSQAGDNPPLRNSVLENEMRSIKEELIGQLYFSKIDERLTHLAPAQGTTCRWFLTGSKYQSWQDVAQNPEHGGFIWIKGNPGTGKSTLMKYLFEATKVNSQNDPSRITLSFFFLARGTDEEKTTTGLYRSLLHQLLGLASDLKDSLDWMTPDGARTIQRNGWSEEALKQTLKYAVPKLGDRSLTMFVDALDECDENKADDMVSFFEDLCDCAAEARVQLQICFSSRHYPTVVINKGLEVSLEDENGHAEDIRKYVKSKLKLTSKSKQTEVLRSEILEKSSGIFLWVVLVLDILNKKKSSPIQKLRDRLKEIPPGLDDLFRMILERDGHNLEQLKLCLNWILFASRALKPQELYFAIQLGSEKECSGFWDQTDLDLEDMKTFVRSSSKGLAEVTRNKASEVQFIHESVRDFLLGQYGDQWSGTSDNLQGHGHQVLRDCCLAQLSASISQKIEIPDPLPRAPQAAELRDSIGLKFPFFKYSVHNVFHHSNLAQRNGLEQQNFLSDFPLQRWIFINNMLEQFETRRYTNSVSLLYILAEKDMADLIRIHSQRKLCFQAEAERCGAPIFAALANNSRKAVLTFLWAQVENQPPTSVLRELCEQYGRHGNHQATFGRSFTSKRRIAIQTLQDLVEMDEEAVAVAFVLSPHGCGQPRFSSNSLDLTLSLAIKRNHEVLVKLLLQGKLPIGLGYRRKCWLGSFLLHAANHGSEAIVKSLLVEGADVFWKNNNGETPLWNAASNGKVAVVKLLLDKGAEIDSENNDGETPLWNAASNGHVAVVKVLLEQGADVDSKDKYGRTSLYQAAIVEKPTCEVVMGLLLDKGANIDSKDCAGETVLFPTVLLGRNTMLKFLLEKGADIESMGENGRTPLSWAAGQQKCVASYLLLRKGADIDARDNNGRTPLSWAAGNSAYRAVCLLLEEGADIKSEDKGGRTPLSWASLNRGTTDFPGEEERVIELLRQQVSTSKSE